MSKNGLNALTGWQQRVLDEERRGEGIVVSAVHPGEVTTDMNKEHGTIMPDEGKPGSRSGRERSLRELRAFE